MDSITKCDTNYFYGNILFKDWFPVYSEKLGFYNGFSLKHINKFGTYLKLQKYFSKNRFERELLTWLIH